MLPASTVEGDAHTHLRNPDFSNTFAYASLERDPDSDAFVGGAHGTRLSVVLSTTSQSSSSSIFV